MSSLAWYLSALQKLTTNLLSYRSRCKFDQACLKICRLTIILPGQTIGLTLAARLTENANISVLILEAGEEKLDDPLISKCELNLSNKHRSDVE